MRRWWHNIEWEAVAALLLALPLLLPFLADGLPNTADAEIHLHRILSAAVNIDAGYAYPRWTPYLHHGFGYPIHNFYAPGVHIVGAWLYLLTDLDAIQVWKLLQALATLLYPLGAYLFVRPLAGRSAALLAAVVYTYAPFRFDELFQQSNLSQYVAMALLPWLFWRISRAAEQPIRRNAAILGLVFAAVVLAHHPTGFLAAPFAGVYAFWVSMAGQRQAVTNRFKAMRPALITTLGGLALGVGLSAIFWLPALAEFRYVQITSIQQGTFSAAANLLPLPDLLRPALPIDGALQNVPRFFMPGWAALGLASLGLAALLLNRLEDHRLRQQVVISTLMLAAALFFMTPPSTWVWENIPIARLVVYPWRLLGIVALAALPGTAACLALLPARWHTWGAALGTAVAALAALPLLYTPVTFYPIQTITPGEAFVYEKRTGNMGLTSGNEYLPIWAEQRPQSGNPLDHQVFEWRVDLDRATLPDGVTFTRETATCRRDTTCYTISAPTPFTLWFNQMYFPGWEVTLGSQPAEVKPEGRSGLIALAIPAGTHRVTIRYGGTPIQHASAILSAAALFITFGLLLTGFRQAVPQPTQAQTTPATRLALGIGGSIVIFCLINQLVLLPYTDFMRPRSNPEHPPAQTPIKIAYGEALQLVGYDLDQRQAAPGSTIRLRLYWYLAQPQAETPRASVLLTDPFGVHVMARAESERVAGQLFSQWQPGKYATDDYTLTIAPDAPPFTARLGVAVFTHDGATITYYLNNMNSNYALVADDLRITGDWRRTSDAALLPLGARFGEDMTLQGAQFYQQDGQTCLRLRWVAERTGMPDYAVLLHFWADEFLQAADAPPLDALYPTSVWQRGQTLDDEHCFAGIPAGARELRVGLYPVNHPVPVNITAAGSATRREQTVGLALP